MKQARGDVAMIKDLLYPEKKQNNKLWQKKNIQNIKEQEERNRRIKEEKENQVEPIPYKLKQFLNVESKIKKSSQDWISESNKIKIKNEINTKPKNSGNIKIKASSKENNIIGHYNNSNEENIYGINNTDSNSLFDQYYRNKNKGKSFVGINARPLSQQNVFGEEVNYQIQKNNNQKDNNQNISVPNLVQNYNSQPTKQGNFNDVNLNDLKDEEINLLLQQYNEQLNANSNILKKNDLNPNIKNMKNLESDGVFQHPTQTKITNNIFPNENENIYQSKPSRSQNINNQNLNPITNLPNENIYQQKQNQNFNPITNLPNENIYQQKQNQNFNPITNLPNENIYQQKQNQNLNPITNLPNENIYQQNQNQNQINNINEIPYNEILIQDNESSSLKEKDAEIEKLIKDYTEKYGWDETIEQLIKEYSSKGKIESEEKYLSNPNNNIKQDYNQPSLPNKNSPLILPKIQKNFIKDNRQLVIENKVPQRTKPKEQQQQVFHKDYGKTPLYIKKYEIENQIRKEEKKRRDEEKKYPKGTKLLSEEERVNTLNGLLNSKKEITNLLEKMPITTRTMAMQNKKEELIQKLEEIEKAIDMFSKKQVFIKI